MGWEIILMVLPLVVILVLLLLKKHMLVAGLAGGVLAIVVSYILVATGTLEKGLLPVDVNNQVVNVGIKDMLSKYLAPVIYAAGAVMIARSGSIKAMVEGLQRLLKGRTAWLAAGIVIVQALATYMAGMGAGNTMVIAPLMAAAVGFVPEVVAGMAIATAVGFTTSPASTETGLAADAAKIEIGEFANMMLPFTIIMFLLGAALAFYGVWRRKGELVKGTSVENEYANATTKDLIVRTVPFFVFLILVIVGGKINGLLPFAFFLPFINVLIAAVLCFFCCKRKTSEISDDLIDGSRYILTTLFGVGIFLGFINLVGNLGTFEALAALVGQAPEWLVTALACIFAFVIAIPSGAFCAGVLSLILPTLSIVTGLSPLAFGLIAISAGLGTQISPVQINVAALSDGFKVEIFDVVKGNMKYVLAAGGLITVVAFIVGLF